MTLEQLRKINNYGKEQLAEYLGISKDQYDELEKNQNLNLTLLFKLCSLYCCNENDLLENSDRCESNNVRGVDLKLVSKLNTIKGNLKLLRRLDGG